MSSGSEFRQFHEEEVVGGPRASYRYLGWGVKHGEGRRCKPRNEAEEDRDTTDLLAMVM